MVIAVKKLRLLTPFRLILVSIALVVAAAFQVPTARAQTADELRARSAQLQAEINANQAKVDELHDKADDLQSKLTQLGLEIETAQKQIELTTNKIAELTDQLDKATRELERQKELLKTSIRRLYKGEGASSLELLVGSDSFSDYFNEQTYLEKLKSGITESAKKVQELKKQISEQKQQQEDLLAQQKVQKQVLDDKRAEQQSILNETQGQQAAYQGIVDAKRAELAAAEQQLKDLLRRLAEQSYGGNVVSYGYVTVGTRIGSVGSTGFSTGPHMHFSVYSGGQFINPRAGGDSLVYDLLWPVPTRGWGDVSQEFGCVAPYSWYADKCANGNSLHTGMDISSWYGEPVVAAASGNIVYRGWMGGYGFLVIVDHGGGLLTYYPHMLAQ